MTALRIPTLLTAFLLGSSIAGASHDPCARTGDEETVTLAEHAWGEFSDWTTVDTIRGVEVQVRMKHRRLLFGKKTSTIQYRYINHSPHSVRQASNHSIVLRLDDGSHRFADNRNVLIPPGKTVEGEEIILRRSSSRVASVYSCILVSSA